MHLCLQIKQAHQSFFVLADPSRPESRELCPTEDEEYYSEGHERNVSRGEYNSGEWNQHTQEYGYYSEGNIVRSKSRLSQEQVIDDDRRRYGQEEDFDSDGYSSKESLKDGYHYHSDGNIVRRKGRNAARQGGDLDQRKRSASGPIQGKTPVSGHDQKQKYASGHDQKQRVVSGLDQKKVAKKNQQYREAGGSGDDNHSDGHTYDFDDNMRRVPWSKAKKQSISDGNIPRKQRRSSRQERSHKSSRSKQQRYREQGGYESDQSADAEEEAWRMRTKKHGRKVSGDMEV